MRSSAGKPKQGGRKTGARPSNAALRQPLYTVERSRSEIFGLKASYWSMAKEALLTMDGVVEEVLRNTQFRVSMANGASVLAYACARLRQNRIRIIAGDKVTLEISPYDLTRGRINFRHKDERPVAAAAPRRFPFKRK